MSHFSVIVIGPDVDAQLAPYNEQPDPDDDRVVREWVDETDGLKKQYETGTVKVFRAPDGTFKFDVSENGAQPEDVKFTEMYPSFDSFVQDYFGYKKTDDGRYGYDRYPNAKWDWYQIGGRWAGYFMPKRKGLGLAGDSGVLGANHNLDKGWVDQIQLGDIDLDGMIADARANAAAEYTDYETIVMGLDVPEPWDTFRQRFEDIDAARAAWAALPYIQAFRTSSLNHWLSDPVTKYGVGRERFIERAGNRAIAPYAFVMNGQWHGRGDMGWFGMSRNEVDADEWSAKFVALLQSLPQDTLLTAVDCHI